MPKVIIDPLSKAHFLISHYRNVYLKELEGGSSTSFCDEISTKAAEHLQQFIDGYVEDFSDKDMMVDRDNTGFPEQEVSDE